MRHKIAVELAGLLIVKFIFLMPQLRVLANCQHIELFLAQKSDDFLLDIVVGVQPPSLARLQMPTLPYSSSEAASLRRS